MALNRAKLQANAMAMKTADGTLGPRKQGRAFHGDILKGESEHLMKPGQTEDLRGGLTHRTTTDPYRAKARAVGTQDWVQDKIAAGDIEGGMAGEHSGTSIFDPVLCEIAYRWYCPPGGMVLDPFAGGSVRGIVASRLGRRYVGIELRPEQIAANRAQLALAGDPAPEWREGDARDVAAIAKDIKADLIFSCPPYWNLEVYSDDARDLSTMARDDFFAAQAIVIRDSVSRLKADRFAMWVCGDVRDKSGFYVNMFGETVRAFEQAGARLYNQKILVTACGSLPIRIRKQFESGRKVGNTHQYVLVFCKGDWKKATAACGPTEFGDIEGAAEPPVAPSIAGPTADNPLGGEV